MARTGGASRFIFEQDLCPFGFKSVDGSFEGSRKMRKYTIFGLAIMAIFTLLGISQLAKAAPTRGFLLIPSENPDGSKYSMLDLGMALEGDVLNYPAAINNRGQVVGRSMPPDGGPYDRTKDLHSYLYEDGAITYIGNGIAEGINDFAQVVGYEWPKCFLYADGHREYLNLGYDKLFVTGINNNGQIIGYSDGQSGLPRGCFLSEDGVRIDFGGTAPRSINDQGTIVGFDGRYAFIYKDDELHHIVEGDARDINNREQVVGSSQNKAFFWEDGHVQILSSLGGDSYGYAINDNAEIVGSFFLVAGNREELNLHAFIYKKGIMKDLNSLIPGGSGWTLYEAVDISNSGCIIACGLPEPDQYYVDACTGNDDHTGLTP
ncbi:hypothetical protein MUP77_17820, partial [Candidatus Bathyarchaeota archaeon]|nr:hypothetical protein [Candidatus Bathyarchaeota archaeon]